MGVPHGEDNRHRGKDHPGNGAQPELWVALNTGNALGDKHGKGVGHRADVANLRPQK